MDKMQYLSKNDGKVRQLVAALIVNLASLSYGSMCGWTSPMIPLLREKNSPIGEIPLSEEGASWIGGFFCLSSLLAAPFSGYLIEKLGRKRFGYAVCVPMIVSWLLMIFATSHTCLFVARFVAGFSGMCLYLVPIYVSEIASEDIRGALGSLLLFGINIGILLAFIMGPLLPYTMFCLLLMSFPLMFLGTFFFMPETPVYLVRQNRLSEARKSLMFFKGNNEVLVDQEMCRLQSQINKTSDSNKIGIFDLFKDRATFKGIIIALALLGGQQLSGINAMISYAEPIFKMSGSSMSPNTSSIVIGAIQVFGSYLSTVLMERAGRRPLILISCIGMCVCHFIVGLFCYLQTAGYEISSVSWIPVTSLSIYMITYCLGMGPAPYVVASEIFRVDVSSFANTICYIYLWLMAFLMVKFFGPLMDIVGIAGCFFMLGIFCAGSFVFAYFMVPETKGRKREEIVDQLAGICRPNSYYDENVYVNDKNLNSKDLTDCEQL